MKVRFLPITIFFLFSQINLFSQECQINLFADQITCNDCGSIFTDVSGGTPPYTYDWNFGWNDPNPVVCGDGVYCVTVTDADGLSCVGCVDVFSPPIPTVDIIPSSTCINGNGDDLVFTTTTTNGPGISWFWMGPNGFTSTNQTAVIPNATADDVGTYCVIVTDDFGCSAEECVDIENGLSPEIEILAGPICPDPASDCQKVCENTTFTYAISDVSPNEPIDWEISGAESFEENGEQVTVTWGDAGFGSVEVTVGAPSGPPFTLDCGVSMDVSPDGFVVFANPQGSDNLPYEIFIDGVSSGLYGQGIITIGAFDPGVYTLTAIDDFGNGEQQNCVFTIPQPNTPWCDFTVITTPTSSCNTCDGIIEIQLFGSNLDNLNGNINGLDLSDFEPSVPILLTNQCPGNYSIEIQTIDGCFSNKTVVLPCPTNSCTQGDAELCVEILQTPKAQIATDPPHQNGVLDICTNQSINFQNLTIGATSHFWDFGDLNTSVLENPTHTYPSPGTYQVQLIARNECFCADTATVIVNVSNLEIPEIECVGTVCEGESVTYETQAQCSDYQWNITGGGNILDGGGSGDNFITVEWETGPEGAVELSVNNCNPALCNATTIAEIPIITDNISVIEGADKVCPGEVEIYTIPDFGGSEVIWSTSAGGVILEGQNTNQITIEWIAGPNDNPQFVAVSYENCYLGCGGSDMLEVNMLSEYYVDGPVEICQNETTEHSSIDANFDFGVQTNWEILDNLGNSVASSSSPVSTFSFEWGIAAGLYILRSTPTSATNICTPFFEISVNVLELPAPPTGISGTTTICPNQSYTYTANGLAGHEFHWIINNGGSVIEDFGNSMNIIWNANPPYSISLSQISPVGLNCESEIITQTIEQIQTLAILGEDSRCKEETGIYSTDALEDTEYQWNILPPNAGTITENNDNQIEILWHSEGQQTVQLTICNIVQTFDVTVHPTPEPTVNHPSLLCPNETGPTSTNNVYSNYEWRTEGGSVVSNDATPELSPGFYEVIVTDANGCTGNALFEIEGHPNPNISISAPGELGLCPGGPNITLYALESSGGYDYQWFFNNMPVGGNEPTLEIMPQAGLYQVEVVDENGCTAASNILQAIDCETLGGECIGTSCVFLDTVPPTPDCLGIGDVDFNFSQTANCNVLDFSNNSTNEITGSWSWNFNDPYGGNNFSNQENPSHTFVKPGFYNVFFSVYLPDGMGGECFEWIRKPVPVLAAADFSTSAGCVGEPIQFEDLSTFLPEDITEITDWTWDFGDPASGASNTSSEQNPTHLFPDGGTYLVTLTIITDTDCKATITKNVSVNPPPMVSFTPPVIGCAETAINFVANVDNNVTNVEWNFGDPTSGDANISTKKNTFHGFSNAGDYTVTITATNIFGCVETYSEIVTIEPNNLSGTISFSTPSPICEGENTTLTAPLATTYEWSTGATTAEITVDEEDIYSVTVSDDKGCTFAVPSVSLEVIPAPLGSIRAVEYNEFDQPEQYFDDTYTICEGEEVYLLAQTSANFTFQWSNGEITQEISFTEDKDNLLPSGNYDYQVTITDTGTGCTAIAGPFEVIVNPTPNDVQITSMPASPICDGISAMVMVQNPDPALTYVWNTGEIGTEITAISAGDYFVRVVNVFGCEGESNHIEIQNAPDINKIPGGCHTHCKPDTFCLPPINDVAAYQWFLDGNAIPAPNGTTPNLIATESGEYTVELTSTFGCITISDPIVLDLLDGFGNITGNVYFDINENGIIDGADTLVSGIDIFLIQSFNFLDTVSTNSDGLFGFANILSTDYSLLLDVNNLPPFWNVYQGLMNAELVGCDAEDEVNFLLYKECITENSATTLETCEGTPIEYEGIDLNVGDVQDFTLKNQFDCDSIVTVTVEAIPDLTGAETLQTCEGTTVIYEGVELEIGDIQDFTFDIPNACDSIVTITVEELPNAVGEELFEICEGETIEYEGVELAVGDEQEFILPAVNTCDSLVTVKVEALPVPTGAEILKTCEGTTVNYEGVELEIGDIQDFMVANPNGCDSMVTVSVEALLHSGSDLTLETCAAATIEYEGVDLAVGDEMDFTFVSENGCDSIVSVIVEAVPNLTGTELLKTCEGTTIDYEDTTLEIGDTQDFMFQTDEGCDSIVTVTVEALLHVENDLTLETCEGTMVEYEGQQLAVGDEIDFIFMADNGCDSTVTVFVEALLNVENDLVIETCENVPAEYQGQVLEPGLPQDFVFENWQGCDSTVTVMVEELALSNFDLNLAACENGTVEYYGQDLQPDSEQEFTFPNWLGCDSVVTVFVESLDLQTSNLAVEICDGELFPYESQQLSVGSEQEFILANQFGCDSTVTVSVAAFAELEFYSNTTKVCGSDNDGMIQFTDYQLGIAPFQFSLDGITYQNEPTFENLPEGVYSIFIKDGNDCVHENVAEVGLHPPLLASFQEDFIPCGETLLVEPDILSFAEFYNYNLYDENNVLLPDALTATPGDYLLEVMDGCDTLYEEITLDFIEDPRTSFIHVPNIFSPNGDGINDVFKANFHKDIEILEWELLVFDRWGNLIWNTKNIEDSWDGHVRGKMKQAGVYVWYFKTKMWACGQEFEFYQEGDVGIVR